MIMLFINTARVCHLTLYYEIYFLLFNMQDEHTKVKKKDNLN